MKLVVLINYKLVIMTNILTIKQIILINGSTKKSLWFIRGTKIPTIVYIVIAIIGLRCKQELYTIMHK